MLLLLLWIRKINIVQVNSFVTYAGMIFAIKLQMFIWKIVYILIILKLVKGMGLQFLNSKNIRSFFTTAFTRPIQCWWLRGSQPLFVSPSLCLPSKQRYCDCLLYNLPLGNISSIYILYIITDLALDKTQQRLVSLSALFWF